MKNDSLTKTLANLIFDFQAAKWAFPFLDFIRAGQSDFPSEQLSRRMIGYIYHLAVMSWSLPPPGRM
jgi:hypothetical protein